jgi:hypothetical protein
MEARMKTAALTTYSDLELALMVMLNYFGTGQTRKAKLGSRYVAVQKLVDQICNGSVPAGKGSGAVDPAKLQRAINRTFSQVMDEMKSEVMKNYEQS